MARRNKPLPVDPGPFSWWISTDGERWEPTWCDNLNDAIIKAIEREFGVDIEPKTPDGPWRRGFYMARYRKRVLDLSEYFDAHEWIERLYDQMCDEDGPDEDGDHHPLDELSQQDQRDIEACVRSAIWHFQNRRGLKLSPWHLEPAPGTREEWVIVPLPDDVSETLSEHARKMRREI
ncbi:UNVERIFIED_CONTAM: hypothetical protein BEN50_22250 [Euhalothece sp. KZN 001]